MTLTQEVNQVLHPVFSENYRETFDSRKHKYNFDNKKIDKYNKHFKSDLKHYKFNFAEYGYSKEFRNLNYDK